MQQENKGKILLQKYLDGEANAEERAIVESWQLDFSLQDRKLIDDETALADLAEIRQELIRISGSNKKVKRWSAIAAAASIAVVLGVGGWFYASRHSQEDNIKKDLYASNIAPGKNTATLIHADGKVLSLSGAKNGIVINDAGVKYNDGTSVIPADPGFISSSGAITAATPKGGTYRVTLPDGTHVWLNAASTIRFPARFTAPERRVELTGEAYFEVAKMRMPFIVATDKQEVKVLGTHFNINSYSDEVVTKTTLLEGAVQVSAARGGMVTLSPNQQSVLNGPDIKVTPADAAMAIAWKNGYFTFKSESVPAIMRKLSRWYDVEVVYEKGLSKELFGGRISRYKTLAEVLEMLQSTNLIHFKIEGRRVIVK